MHTLIDVIKLIVLLSGLSGIHSVHEHGKVVPSLRNHSHLNLVLFGQRLMLDVCVDPAINNLHLRISQFPRD